MKKENDLSQRGTSNVIVTSTLFLIGAVASVIFISRKRKKSRSIEAGLADGGPWVPTLPGTDPYTSTTFYKLRLSKLQYDKLRRYEGSTLVFQFYYPKESACGSPTLYSYNMKKNHVPTGKPPEILSYGEPSEEKLRGRNLVLGDQKLEISDLEKLIKKVTKNTGQYSNLIFTPVFLDKNPHETYQVSVDGSSDSVLANPSPPG
jgi:hypothetical protein